MAQQTIAGSMSESVVNFLEPIDAYEQRSDGLDVSLRMLKSLRQAVFKQYPVWQVDCAQFGDRAPQAFDFGGTPMHQIL